MRPDIYIYAPDEDDFSHIGICGSLTPASCEFEEVANGMSELTLVHPMDEHGRYKYLRNEYIIAAPVPTRNAPEIVNNEYVTQAQVWTVKTTATKAQRTIYSKKSSGKKLKVLAESTTVNVTEIPEGSSRARVVYGKTKGWMETDGLQDTSQTVALDGENDNIEKIAPSWASKMQLFRIYSVDLDDGGNITVRAKHISYDLMWNLTTYINGSAVTLQSALDGVLNNTAVAHDFNAYTNITGTRVSAIFRDKDPITCLLDPSTGLATVWGAELIRDNFDMYLLSEAGFDRGMRIEYAKNLAGVNMTTDYSNIATIIRPVGQKKDGTSLYLPEGYVISERAEEYALQRVYTMTCNDCTIGSNGVTEAIAYARMREQAQALFDDNYDLPSVSCEVQFADLGEDPRFEMYRGLEKLFLYDTVRVYHPFLGIDITSQVTGITFDVMRQSITGVTLGEVRNLSQQIAAWQAADGTSLYKVKGDMQFGGLSDYNEPPANMTANSSQGCVAKASSENSSSYAAWKAFNGDTGSSWASGDSDKNAWIQLCMDRELTEITVSVYSREVTSSRPACAPKSGRVLLSNDGTTWTEAASFSGWNGSASAALLGTVACTNTAPYRYVRIAVDTRQGSSYVGIGKISISGKA